MVDTMLIHMLIHGDVDTSIIVDNIAIKHDDTVSDKKLPQNG